MHVVMMHYSEQTKIFTIIIILTIITFVQLKNTYPVIYYDITVRVRYLHVVIEGWDQSLHRLFANL